MGKLISIIRGVFSPKKEDPALQKVRENMQHLRQLTLQVAQDPVAEAYKEDLLAMEAILAQTDDTIRLYQDQRIEAMLLELQTRLQDPAFDAPAKVTQLKTAIDIRDVMAKTKT